jgi:dihydrodipicolinate synthase/N-acetylneuraminate lyase
MTKATTAKYLSAKELKITSRERKWLLRAERVLAKMESEQIISIRGDGEYQFDMGTAGAPIRGASCGTAGCIAGLANLLAQTSEGKQLFEICRRGNVEGHSDALQQLFFPLPRWNYSNITPKKAAAGVRKFLRTGKHSAWGTWEERE